MTGDNIHANCVVVGTAGLLIRGRSGSGKSALSDRLLVSASRLGHLAGFVTDDRVDLMPVAGRLLAMAPKEIEGKLEVRGFGITGVSCFGAARVHLVIDLKPLHQIERLPDRPLAQVALQGVELPYLVCPERQESASTRLIRWGLRRLYPFSPSYI
ncbi:aldolase [Roseibium denhamense]|uniref:Hpr(Ser) kinase/phosphatase n=1 Tax=Roseibium denhamense TaxID=76305 RepID=A0ABY1PLI4_9HYPH|nr:HPr kinase/phosphatase C-terminal domain-containing protein [Roseibium denhamense]MTI05914.1 aldolase [Roseibium denhamense]SMP35747.1 Hpr(Ser) kinase/phosphatase [Roseibium denhamense]